MRLWNGQSSIFVPSAETKCASMRASCCTSRMAPSSLATTVTGWRKNEASNDLLVSWWPLILLLLLLLLLLLCLMVAATTIMLAGSRPSGVTVTAPQNEHHGTCRGDSPGWALTTTTRWFPSRPALYYFQNTMYHVILQGRLEICQKIYTTGFLDQRFYTLTVRNLRLFLLKKTA